MSSQAPPPVSQQVSDDELLASVMQVPSAPTWRDTQATMNLQQSHDDAVLDKVLGANAAGIARKRPPSLQANFDDDVLSRMLGQGPAPDPRQRQDDAVLAKFLQVAGDSLHNPDDVALSTLLATPASSSRKKALTGEAKSGASMAMLVAESINHFSLGWSRGAVHAEVVAGGNGKGNQLHQLFRPLGIAVDSQRGLLVADNGNHRVVRWGLGAMKAPRGDAVIDSQGFGHNWFDPLGLAVVSAGTILVSVSGGVELWDRGAQTPEVIASGNWPAGIAVDSAGTVLFADMLEHCVRQWPSPDESDVVAGGCHGRGAVQLPQGWHPEGDWYCPACGERQCRRSRTCRECSTPRAAWTWTNQLHRPFGIAVDRRDRGAFVADSANHRVVYWARGAKEGVVVAGGKGAGSRPDQLHCPRGVAVDSFGGLLVADTMNHRVMRWPNPLLASEGHRARSMKRGELVAGGSGPGHRVNQLNQPNCLALDADGALYISDTGNHRVVRWHISQ